MNDCKYSTFEIKNNILSVFKVNSSDNVKYEIFDIIHDVSNRKYHSNFKKYNPVNLGNDNSKFINFSNDKIGFITNGLSYLETMEEKKIDQNSNTNITGGLNINELMEYRDLRK